MAEVKVFLTTQELSERAGYPGPNVLHLWRKRGKGPPYLRIESRILYRVADVEAWERMNTIQPARCEMV